MTRKMLEAYTRDKNTER